MWCVSACALTIGLVSAETGFSSCRAIESRTIESAILNKRSDYLDMAAERKIARGLGAGGGSVYICPRCQVGLCVAISQHLPCGDVQPRFTYYLSTDKRAQRYGVRANIFTGQEDIGGIRANIHASAYLGNGTSVI